MSIPRLDHTATLLADGTVLVVGLGWDNLGGTASASAELYDPLRGVWSPIPGPVQPRSGHAATLLRDGTVLISGGTGTGYLGLLTTTELYDPAEGKLDDHWFPEHGADGTHSDAAGRWKGAGRGGSGEGPTCLHLPRSSDPPTGTWKPTSPMHFPRTSHTATLLRDGRVLVVGGVNRSEAPASGEIYDPASGDWNLTDSMPTSRWGHTATLLTSGLVLVAGGQAPFEGRARLRRGPEECRGVRPSVRELDHPGRDEWVPRGFHRHAAYRWDCIGCRVEWPHTERRDLCPLTAGHRLHPDVNRRRSEPRSGASAPPGYERCARRLRRGNMASTEKSFARSVASPET